MHEGHRQRILERLEQSEEELKDHELLEILLFNAIPRKNTNEIAHALLSAFGSFSGVFRANFEQLAAVKGVGPSTAAYLRCVAAIYARADRTTPPDLPSVYNFSQFSQFLRERFRGLTEERIELYALDGEAFVKNIGSYTSGERDSAMILPEEVTKFLLSSHPHALLIAHNHLCNNSNPSREDDLFTAKVHIVCAFHNVRLLDHVIIGPVDQYSYRMNERLEEIKSAFSYGQLFGGDLK